MTYSYTQLAQYLACPLRYRYRYLDGWQEKEARAGLLFGRAFEQALDALLRREDPGCALFEAWTQYKNCSLEYLKNETWDQMLEHGIRLLTRFVQDDRVRIQNPRRNLQIKFSRPIGNNVSALFSITCRGINRWEPDRTQDSARFSHGITHDHRRRSAPSAVFAVFGRGTLV